MRHLLVLSCACIAVMASAATATAQTQNSNETCGWGHPITKDTAALCRSLNAIGVYVAGGFTNTKQFRKYVSPDVVSGADFIVKSPWQGSKYTASILEYQLLVSKKVHGRPYYVFRADWEIFWRGRGMTTRIGPDSFRVMSIYGTKLYSGRHFH